MACCHAYRVTRCTRVGVCTVCVWHIVRFIESQDVHVCMCKCVCVLFVSVILSDMHSHMISTRVCVCTVCVWYIGRYLGSQGVRVSIRVCTVFM